MTAGATEAPSRGARAKQQLVRMAIAVGAAALLFFLGWMMGRSPVGGLDTRLEAAETRIAVLTAEAAAHRAAVALEARNFGTANEHLRQAAAALGRLPAEGDLPGLSEADAAAVREVRTALGGTDLNVAVDVERQRSQVLAFAERLAAAAQ